MRHAPLAKRILKNFGRFIQKGMARTRKPPALKEFQTRIEAGIDPQAIIGGRTTLWHRRHQESRD